MMKIAALTRRYDVGWSRTFMHPMRAADGEKTTKPIYYYNLLFPFYSYYIIRSLIIMIKKNKKK